MSISWAGSFASPQCPPASSASAGLALPQAPNPHQHHEHQLGWLFRKPPTPTSIVSISWAGSFASTQRLPASSASTGLALPQDPNAHQHHQHQLGWLCRKPPVPERHHQHQPGWLFRKPPTPASIMSISWAGFAKPPTLASIISWAGSSARSQTLPAAGLATCSSRNPPCPQASVGCFFPKPSNSTSNASQDTSTDCSKRFIVVPSQRTQKLACALKM